MQHRCSARWEGHMSVIPSVMWLVSWPAKVSRILRCDWLPEREIRRYLALSGWLAVSQKNIVYFLRNNSFTLTQLGKMAGYWQSSCFYEFMVPRQSRVWFELVVKGEKKKKTRRTYRIWKRFNFVPYIDKSQKFYSALLLFALLQ